MLAEKFHSRDLAGARLSRPGGRVLAGARLQVPGDRLRTWGLKKKIEKHKTKTAPITPITHDFSLQTTHNPTPYQFQTLSLHYIYTYTTHTHLTYLHFTNPFIHTNISL